jgi:hypothetical protein
LLAWQSLPFRYEVLALNGEESSSLLAIGDEC